MLKVGDKAPDFELVDQNNNKVNLNQYHGHWVVLYFYPKALTPGCTVQACGLRDAADDLKTNNIAALGVSADKPEKLQKFTEQKQLNFTLLSDVDKHCIEAYGVWQKKKFMGREYMGIVRWTFIIDPNGVIRDIMTKVKTKTHHQDVIQIIKNLQTQ